MKELLNTHRFIDLLSLMFIYLKLTGQIDWSWWWVTLPLWGGLVILLLVIGVSGLALYLSEKKTTNKTK